MKIVSLFSSNSVYCFTVALKHSQTFAYISQHKPTQVNTTVIILARNHSFSITLKLYTYQRAVCLLGRRTKWRQQQVNAKNRREREEKSAQQSGKQNKETGASEQPFSFIGSLDLCAICFLFSFTQRFRCGANQLFHSLVLLVQLLVDFINYI